MKNVAKMIGAVMRAMRVAAQVMVMVPVWVGGRLISMLVPAPMPAMDELEPAHADERAVTGQESEFMAIRNLAAARFNGQMPSPELLAECGRLPVDWLSAMPRPMLKQVLCSTDSQLRAHMRGRKSIRGLLAYDAQGIEEYRISMIRQAAREEAAKRNMTAVRYA